MSSEPSSARDQRVPTGPLAFVTQRPVAITMFVLAMAVFGLVSFAKLRVDLLPEISYPTLTVRTTWDGAAPEDVEQRVSERVQESLSTLPDLVRSTSISRAGISDVVLDFDWGTAMTFAVQDVREKLDGVFLPNGVDRPLILRYDPNLDPILRIGVRAADNSANKGDFVQLRWFAENRIKRELEALQGVAAVQVRGGLEEEIRVRLDPFKLAGLGVDPTVVANRLAQENINASGGSVREGSTEYLVRTLNEFENVADIEDLAVLRRGDAVIRIRDIGTVERSHAEREVVSRLAGDEAVEIAIYREAGANIVQLANSLKERIFGTEEQQAEARRIEEESDGPGSGQIQWGERNSVDFMSWRLREEVDLELLSDQSVFIEDAIDDVKNAAILGSLFAVAVIWIFLRRLSATAIIALSIPISVVVTFAPMYLLGASLNIMSLGGLALGVGMLVDNAIVVLESITRCREEGDNLSMAAVRGVREVAGAVTASTLTTVAVFAPIVFVTGIAGQIFGDQALTVVTALFVSLIVAVFFIPMLASRGWLAGEARREAAASPPRIRPDQPWGVATFVPNLLTVIARSLLLVGGLIVRALGFVVALLYRLAALIVSPFAYAFNALWNALEAVYVRLLRGALAAPWLVVLIAIGLSWVAAQRVKTLGIELLPEIHQGEFTAFVKLEVGTPLETTDEVMTELDRSVRAVEGVRTTALTAGIESETLSRDIEGPHTSRLTVRLDDAWRSPELEESIVNRVRGVLGTHPAVRSVEIRRPTPFALDSPVAVEVKGHDLEQITEVSHEVLARLESIEGLADLRTSVRPGFPEARVTFDRDKTLEYQLDLGQVSNMVRDQVLGNVSTRFTEGDDRIDVRVVGDESILDTVDAVLELAVNPAAENPVPLRSVASVEIVQGPAEIRRFGNSRGVVLTAETTGLDLGGLTASIEGALADLIVPTDVFVELGGQKREMDEAQTSMKFALFLAVFLVYVVMASQFESLIQPFVILLTVPLAGVGVVFVLDWLEIPLSVVVFIGLIMLAGIVVNNAIVLVDRINQKRLQGLDMRAAVEEAGRARLRPILMTTATTALGLLPLTGWLGGLPVIGAMGAGEGAEIRAPMAVAVISGLVTSTLLTLIVIPAVYSVVARRWRRADATDAAPVTGQPVASQ